MPGALVKERVWPSVEYVPHEYQVKIHRSKARHKVAAAGRRLGKSHLGGHELTVEALYTHTVADILRRKGKRREFWIVGPEYSDSEKEFRVLWNDLSRLEVPFDRPGSYNNPESGEMVISLWGGRFKVIAKSAKYPGTLVGEELAGVIMAEAAKQKQIVWTKYIRPMLADTRGWSLHTSTPEGKNHFYELWKRGQDPNDTAWDSWKIPSWFNPIVFPEGATPEAIALLMRMLHPENQEDQRITVKDVLAAGMDPEILDMALDMSAERFKQEIGADFTEFVGRVFKDFDEEIHVRDLQYRPDLPLYGACDYGWTNPFVWLAIQVDTFGNVYVLAEYRAIQKDINDISRDLSALPAARRAAKFYPDPAEPGDTAVLSKVLKVPFSKNTGGEKKWRLELIRQHLRPLPLHVPIELRQPRIFIDRSCVELIREMQDYRYPETKAESLKAAPEEPLDKDDHGPEALGRFFRGHFGPPPSPGKRNARVRTANMSGARRAA